MASRRVKSDLEIYLKQIDESPLLTAEQEKALSRRIIAENCPESREHMVRSNLRLVVKIAFEYRRAGDAEAGESAEVWIQYRLGTPPLAVRGGFAVEQRRVVFGPIPQGYWNDLATYSPFRLRVVDARGKARSGWVEYEVVEAR